MPAARPSVPVSTRPICTWPGALLRLDLAGQLGRGGLGVGHLLDDASGALRTKSSIIPWVSWRLPATSMMLRVTAFFGLSGTLSGREVLGPAAGARRAARSAARARTAARHSVFARIGDFTFRSNSGGGGRRPHDQLTFEFPAEVPRVGAGDGQEVARAGRRPRGPLVRSAWPRWSAAGWPCPPSRCRRSRRRSSRPGTDTPRSASRAMHAQRHQVVVGDDRRDALGERQVGRVRPAVEPRSERSQLDGLDAVTGPRAAARACAPGWTTRRAGPSGRRSGGVPARPGGRPPGRMPPGHVHQHRRQAGRLPVDEHERRRAGDAFELRRRTCARSRG